MKYELMLILSPKQTDKDIEKNLKEVKGLLTENGFDLVDEDIWGMRDLAYKIHGNSKGYYVVLNFSGEAAGVLEVQKDLRLQAGILRSMLTKVPDDYVLLHYETLATTGKASKISSPAEELNKKVRGQQARGATKTTAKKEEEAPTQENTEKLDETLKAIIEDKDII
ncbi:MAG TPA: 30S ribosomal protein S6 [Candidatus Omnitrophota bacterium]|nr:30S ribosomal protein S6 [Candidatus Omnitrophota bacterium]